MEAELRSNPRTRTSFSCALRASHGGLLDGPRIETLLVHCAAALESNDVTLAQQAMWVLNSIASSQGDPNQRLISWLLHALVARACRLCPNQALRFPTASMALERAMSVTELAHYVDLTPWHRFGFSASNSAILRAVGGQTKVHILDLSITHCMQWPTLIDKLSKRPKGPPSLRVTIPSVRPAVLPLLGVSSEELGLRLVHFAKSKGVQLEFKVIKSSTSQDPKSQTVCQELASVLSNPLSLGLRNDEALVVNCQNWLRYVAAVDPLSKDETDGAPCSRDGLLNMIHMLNPCIVTVTDEDADLDSPSLTSRIMGCFNFHWILFEALDTFLPKDSPYRSEYEAGIGHKIENIVGFEGMQRTERSESGVCFAERMRRKGFASVGFDEEMVTELRHLLSEHATGWGMKREEDMLVLTWKGHGAVFTSAWVPN